MVYTLLMNLIHSTMPIENRRNLQVVPHGLGIEIKIDIVNRFHLRVP